MRVAQRIFFSLKRCPLQRTPVLILNSYTLESEYPINPPNMFECDCGEDCELCEACGMPKCECTCEEDPDAVEGEDEEEE